MVKPTATQKIILDLYDQYHHPRFLEWDPLLVARRFQNTADIELISLISALFAFGGVKQIIASVERVLLALSTEKQSLMNILLSAKNESELSKFLLEKLNGFRHRIYVDRDLILLLLLYRRSCLVHGGLKNHFLKYHAEASETIEAGLTGLIEDYRNWVNEIDFQGGVFFKHMLNSPKQKSACKRWVMFLKWMVRKDDGLDLGLWANESGLTAQQLIIPMDTHLFKISKKLKLTKRKTANWLTAVEVTRSLKKLDPVDPTRFDFSLCRYGMFQYRKNMQLK